MRPEDNHLLQTIKSIITPIHSAGYVFIAIFAVVALVLGLLWAPLGWVGLVLTLWCVYFFRDPIRTVPEREGLVVSPADGLVQMILPVVPPAELNLGTEPLTRISIFLNVFNVHVNRAPIAGTVTSLLYMPGLFLNASLDKASDENERQLITITTPGGKAFGVVQIAGLIARRIICDLRDGQQLRTGERFGLIRFGSRTDIYLPPGVAPMVVPGQVAVGGETIIADINSSEIARIGRKE